LENLHRRFFLLKEKLLLTKYRIKPEVSITYRLLESGEEKSIKLSQWATDPEQGRISMVSPLGLALVDKKVGEIGEVRTNRKVYKVQIIGIK
jgi:transcription elongation GreA/GreB family factor